MRPARVDTEWRPLLQNTRCKALLTHTKTSPVYVGDPWTKAAHTLQIANIQAAHSRLCVRNLDCNTSVFAEYTQ